MAVADPITPEAATPRLFPMSAACTGAAAATAGGGLLFLGPSAWVPSGLLPTTDSSLGHSRAAVAVASSPAASAATGTWGAHPAAVVVPGALLGVAVVGGRRLRRRGAGKRVRLVRRLSAVLENQKVEKGVSNGVSEPPVLGLNPAIDKPMVTSEYPEEYDITKPKESFLHVGEMIIKELIEELPAAYELPQKEVEWVTRSLNYNTLGGKMNRGLITVETGRALMLNQGRTPTSRDLHRFAVLGWAVEFLQACMLMADDMMDGSLTRRGEPCWYKLPEVGLLNTNDFLMVEMMVYKIVRRHFGQDPFYPWIVDLFLETTFQTECGQLLDSICANCELEELTTSRWTLVVKYKTAFYSFYLPVALAMLAAGVRDRAAFDKAREVLMVMGIFFQAQDDFLDAFVPPEELGKVGTDIVDKKCSWLFAHAYHEVGDAESKELFDQYYGNCKVDSKEEKAIKEAYIRLGLKEMFKNYEDSVVEKLQNFKHEVEEVGLPWSIFESFFGKIFKRKK